MALHSVVARNFSLDCAYGTSRAPGAPDWHWVALFVGDPMLDEDLDADVHEIVEPGYARGVVLPEHWAPAEDGRKPLLEPAELPEPTAAWTEEPDHWALIDEDGHIWDTGPLTEPLEVGSAGLGPLLVDVEAYYGDSVESEE